MKKIFNILIVMLVVSVAFTSCDSDDSTSIPDTVLTTAKSVSFSDALTVVESSATTYNLPVDVTPSTFSGNYLIEYTINGQSASATFAGGQAAQIPLDVSGFGSVVITLDRITVIGTEVGVVDESNKTTEILIAPARDADSMQLVLTWPDASNNDLDFFVTDAATFIVDSSQSVSANEDIALPNSEPDGGYRVFVRNWTSDLDPIPFTILTTQPDGTVNVYNGDIPNISFQFNEALTIVKTGSSYVITHLNPTVPL